MTREEAIKLLKAVKNYMTAGNPIWDVDIMGEAFDIAIDALEVNPIKHGKWKWELANNGWADHICSECGFTENTDIHVSLGWKYCPNCGAKMDKRS